MDDIERNLSNFCCVPNWHTTMSAKEVERIFKINNGMVICNGKLRSICVDKITENIFRVYTKRFKGEAR
jgi:hypothetical protein